MRTRTTRTARIVLLSALGASACQWAGSPAVTPAVTRLAVEDRDNATPAIAARDRQAVVTWSAAMPEGGTDIFAAVSDDGGVTFRAPVRVNDLVREARANGEQPPRVAIGPKDIGVVWTTRRDGLTEVRLSRSSDGGRTFGASVPVHPQGLTGARGWMSITSDATGAMHVAWLDGRNSPPKAAAPAAKPAPPKPPVAPAAPGAKPAHQHKHTGGAARQDLYHAVFRADGSIAETQVATNVCFCCKTAVVTDPDGRASIVWRHIFPNSMRDMALRTIGGAEPAADAVRISEDQWQLEGCPDDGPAMVKDAGGRIHVVWPTLVSGANPSKGIFYTSSADRRTFLPRVRLDDGEAKAASHPQIAVAGAGGLVALWDEPRDGTRRVMLRERPGADWKAVEALEDEAPAMYPAAVSTTDALVVVWTSATTPRSTIVVYRKPSAR
jgi:hypothetical protein